MTDEKKKVSDLTTEELVNLIEETINKNHRLNEMERRIIYMQRKYSGESKEGAWDMIRENGIGSFVLADELREVYRTFKTPQRLTKFINELPPDITYLAFQGYHWKARFVFVGEENSLVNLAIKLFKKTPFGDVIRFNASDKQQETEINYYIGHIFSELVMKGEKFYKKGIYVKTKKGIRLAKEIHGDSHTIRP